MIQGLGRGARAEVDRLQPYHRRKSPENRVLSVLRDLSNRDKHRAPPMTVMTLVDSQTRLAGSTLLAMRR